MLQVLDGDEMKIEVMKGALRMLVAFHHTPPPPASTTESNAQLSQGASSGVGLGGGAQSLFEVAKSSSPHFPSAFLYCCLFLSCPLTGAVWCSVVQGGAVWCSVVRCGAVWCSVVQCGAVWCGVVQCGAIWCSGAGWCSVLRCGAIWCSGAV